MAGPVRSRAFARFALAATMVVASLGTTAALGAASRVDAAESTLSPWTGGLDLYRSGVYTVQKTWLWCTAADVQIIRNIVAGEADHSKSGQQRYFDYMRAHNQYPIPVKDGVDAAGWAAGLDEFVDPRYQLYQSESFDSALRSAVTNIRETGLPVAFTVQHGNHAWIMTGFTATADPAATTDFTVTTVRVVGPLWGLQSRTYGYDMKPDTKLTPKQLEGFFTPWHYTSIPMAWENRWVSVQPVAVPPAVATAAPSAPAPRRERLGDLRPIATPSTDVISGALGPTTEPSAQTEGASPTSTRSVEDPGAGSWPYVALALALFGIGVVAWLARRRRQPRA